MEGNRSLGEYTEWFQGATELKAVSDAAGVAALISALTKVERTYGADTDEALRKLSRLAFKRLSALLENIDVNDYVGGKETKS